MSGAVPAPLDDATIIRALQASKAEAAAGRMAESDQLRPTDGIVHGPTAGSAAGAGH